MPTYTLRVNGRSAKVESWDPDQPLLYVLRNQLGLFAPKFGCGLGQCGTCMVLVDGKATPSCVTPVRQAAGRTVTTLEALGTAARPGRLQAAFIAEQAAQCGYCTNGMIIAATALLRQTPHPTREQVTQGLAPNLCRCGTHTRIVNAVLRAAGA
jgi:nicotinate dehydrogenase subunit A